MVRKACIKQNVQRKLSQLEGHTLVREVDPFTYQVLSAAVMIQD